MPDLDTIFSHWWTDQIQNSPVSRAGSEVVNHLSQALADLKKRLQAVTAKEK
jgi:hypothetical protein